MDFMVWCDLFKIGHPIIDEQHQKLIVKEKPSFKDGFSFT